MSSERLWFFAMLAAYIIGVAFTYGATLDTVCDYNPMRGAGSGGGCSEALIRALGWPLYWPGRIGFELMSP